MATQNGVYETATGDLLRVGIGVDFVNDGSFDSSNETQRTDVPIPAKLRGDTKYGNMHRWNGSAWVQVTQALVPIASDYISDMSVGGWNPSANLIAHYPLEDIKDTDDVVNISPIDYWAIMIGGNTEDINIDSLISGGKSAHDFDGSTHAHNIDTTITSGNLPTATKGTLCIIIEPDIVATDELRFFSFGDADAETEIGLMQGVVNGTVKAWCRIAGTLQWEVETNNVVISNGTKAWVILVQDGAEPFFMVGDVANGMRKVPATFSVSLSKSKWFNDASGLDTARIGVKQVNAVTEKYFNGTLQDARIYDSNWSLNDAVGWFNNALGTKAESGMVPWTPAELLTFLGVEIVSQADAEAGTSTTRKGWTPERVKQAIAALESGGGPSIVLKSASFTAVDKTIYICDTNAASSDIVVTMISSPTAGNEFTVRLKTDHATRKLTVNGETFIIAGEWSRFVYDGSAWNNFAHLIPCRARVTRDAAQTITNAVKTYIDFDAEEHDNCSMATTGTSPITIRRAGEYLFVGGWVAEDLDDSERAWLRFNLAGGFYRENHIYPAGTNKRPALIATQSKTMAVGNTGRLQIEQREGANMDTLTGGYKPFLDVIEIV